MTLLGILLLDAFGVALLVWLLNSIRKGRLYVGYGVIFVAGVVGLMITISVPSLFAIVRRGVDLFFPRSGLAVVGLAATALILIYVMGQLTILSNRVALIVQQIAIRDVARAPERAGEGAAAEGDRHRASG